MSLIWVFPEYIAISPIVAQREKKKKNLSATKLALFSDLLQTGDLGHSRTRKVSKSQGSILCGADCCVLVYDVNVLRSFETLQNWHQEFLKQAGPADTGAFPFILVGNKIDIDGGNSRAVWTYIKYIEAEAFHHRFYVPPIICFD